MIFGNKLLSSFFNVSFSQVPMLQADTKKQRWVYTAQVWSLYSFFDPSPSLFGFGPYFRNHCARSSKLRRQVFLNFSAEPWR